MKVLAVLSLVAFMAICYGADKNLLERCNDADNCLGDTVCYRTGTCETGRCLCPTGYKHVGNSCIKFRLIGESCSSPSDCINGGEMTNCTDGRCACVEGLSPDQLGMTCDKHVGDQCSANSDCRYSTTMECKDSKCACKGVTTPIRGGKSCGLNAFGEYCREGNDCSTRVCTNNKCACECGMIPYKGRYCIHVTATTVSLGAKCDYISERNRLLPNQKYCEEGLECIQCSGSRERYCMEL